MWHAIGNRLRLPIALAMLAAVVAAGEADAGEWVTWRPVEPDTCASIWLIKRHVDTEATFRLVEKGTMAVEGTPFDTPTAELRRYHNLSTYESILGKYQLSDAKVKAIAVIVHDMEINIWGKKADPRSDDIEREIRASLDAVESDDAVIAKCLDIGDSLDERIGRGTGATVGGKGQQ